MQASLTMKLISLQNTKMHTVYLYKSAPYKFNYKTLVKNTFIMQFTVKQQSS